MGGLDAMQATPGAVAWDDESPLARWAAETRAELARIAAELRSLPERSGPEADAAVPCGEPVEPVAVDFAPMVERLRIAAMARVDAEAAAARLDADRAIARAIDRALTELRQDRSRPAVPSTRPTPATDVPYRPAHLRIEDPEQEDEDDLWAELDLEERDVSIAGPILDLPDPAQVHEAFWADVLVEGPVRRRFRRRAKVAGS
jgi:hypothetical protein